MTARGVSLIALSLVLILTPMNSGLVLSEDPLVLYSVVLVPSDLALAALVLVVAWRMLRRRGRPSIDVSIALFAAVLALLFTSFLLQPSAIGAQTVFRMLGALAIAVTVADLAASTERLILVVLLTALALIETAISVAQVIAEAPLGIFGEAPGPLLVHAASFVPRGTFLHPYPLAGFALLVCAILVRQGVRSGRTLPWFAGAALAIVPVGITYSRAALLGYAAGLVALARPAFRRPVYRWALLALVLGAGIPALVWNDGWIARAEQEDTSGSYRELLQEEAVTLIGEHPLTGVGTGRYVEAARLRFPTPRRPVQPVHSVPLMVAAEAGILAGAVFLLVLGVLGWRAVRSDPTSTALFLMLVPYVLVDIYPYLGWQGPVILGMWIGSLGLATRAKEQT